MKTKKKIHFHGELYVVQTEEVRGVEVSVEQDIKLADSEVTGNDHMLRKIEGLAVFRDEDADKFFVKVDKEPTKIYCKLPDRHTDLMLLKGTYEIGKAQEWDYANQVRRNVLD